MKTAYKLLASVVVIATAVNGEAQAAPVIFNATGTFANGATLSGTLGIDTTLGLVTSSTLKSGSTTFSVFDTVDSGPSATYGGYAEYIGSDPTFSEYIALLFPTQTLVGYSGGGLDTFSNPSPTGYISGIQPADIGATTLNLVAAAPEPATWAMMILGFGLAGYALRRRQKVATRVSYAV